VAEIV